ncbi:MAG: GntR family transcriptional regulator [Clostridia bacterium]|nr:GntR family transcriptional regulator [Clostridia bacterium]
MKIEYDSGRALYLQLRDKLRDDIVSGVYASGQRLPGVRDLAFAAQVNPNTMQRALVELENEGIIITKSTSGRVVTDDESVIEKAKQDILAEITEEYLARLEKFHINKAETAALIGKYAPDDKREGS